MQASTRRRAAVLPPLRLHSAGTRVDLRAILRAAVIVAAALAIVALR